MKKPVFLITMGDPAGIGAEIIVKSIFNHTYNAKLIIIGDLNCIKDAIKFCNAHIKVNLMKNTDDKYDYHKNIINLISLSNLKPSQIKYKINSPLYGDLSFKYLIYAIKVCNNNKADGIVTGPINKQSLMLSKHNFDGHTEILAKYTKTKNYGMLLKSKHLNVMHVTTHCPLNNVSKKLNKKDIIFKINLLNTALINLGYKNPKIAVAGLNPHCSDNGKFGIEEKTIISPAIAEAKERYKINVSGPYPADTVFVKTAGGEFDGVVAMYHDQGHIAVKYDGFQYDSKTNKFNSLSGINITVGIPFIRTSVDHGTAFGKAGEGRANEQSMVEAISSAIRIYENKL